MKWLANNPYTFLPARWGVILCVVLTCLAGCDAFEVHPYDGRISGDTNINERNIARIEAACEGREQIRFVFMSDTQRWYDDTKEFVKAVNKQADIDFVIHGGDISDFGLTKEYLWMRDIMNGLHVPYVVLLGNHDCLANGEQIYKKVYGEPDFAFMAGNTRFVCLNTNALEFDYSRPVPDFGFISDQLSTHNTAHEKTVVTMHAPPFCEVFNNNVATIFQRYLKTFPQLQFCAYGHNHTLAVNDLFNDGTLYYGVPNIKKRQYLIFTLKPDDTYDCEVVEF